MASYMKGMEQTSSRDPWAPDEQQPREGSGRFGTKVQTVPETALITAVPWHLRVNVTPTSAADNPLLVEYLSAQAEHGDTAERWVEAINAYFDADENPRNDDDVFTIVEQTVGSPRSLADVDHWTARTHAWRDHALAALAADDTD